MADTIITSSLGDDLKAQEAKQKLLCLDSPVIIWKGRSFSYKNYSLLRQVCTNETIFFQFPVVISTLKLFSGSFPINGFQYMAGLYPLLNTLYISVVQIAAVFQLRFIGQKVSKNCAMIFCRFTFMETWVGDSSWRKYGNLVWQLKSVVLSVIRQFPLRERN